MKFILADLKEGVSVEVRGSYDPKAIDVEFPDMLFTEPVVVGGQVEKSAGTLRFQGTLTTAIKRVCGRCLKEMAEPLSLDFDWIFDVAGKDVVEPVENVRELLILEHPLAHVCTPACKGLCPMCGIDLNEATCKCKDAGFHTTPVIIKREHLKKEKKHGKS
ncbi:MAG: DUF177 domain-containing protein [Candidatus Omnitrophica bacterium]|nr:DUF177 domain-containing protein [Candidatus Omnitrophota bacterium]